MPPRSPGWRTSPASSCIRIRCAPTISIIPTSCASTSIRCPASSGPRFARSRASSGRRSSDFGLVGWPKTSGSRGMHVYVRIERRWTFDEVRRAALALAREVERRAPALATSKWWKEERHGVFLDYNQNAKDRTVASAYSVRPTPDARVSAPLTWDEVDACEPADFTLATMPARFADDRRSARGIDRAPVLARARCSSCRRGRSAKASAMRRGRRTTRSSRASRRACSRRARRDAEASADRDRARAEERRCARRARALEGAASRGGRRIWSRPTCSSTRCAGDSTPGRGSASTCSTCQSRCGLLQEPLDPDETTDDWGGVGDVSGRARAAPKTFSSS